MSTIKQEKKSLIKVLRFKSGLSQKELAEELEVSQATISYWENFELMPSRFHMEKLEKIARHYRVNLTVRKLINQYKGVEK